MFVTYPIQEIMYSWDPKYDIAYFVVQVMGRQLELMDESGKTNKANVPRCQDHIPSK